VTPAPEARIEEIALARYRDVILDRLLTAIEPEPPTRSVSRRPPCPQSRPLPSLVQRTGFCHSPSDF
jgi:hypothetical protein